MLGINDLLFSVGDDSMSDFLWSVQFLPVVRMVSVRLPAE